jgi:hypothetical protein
MPTVVISLCHNIQHERLTHTHQRALLTTPDSHQSALTIRSNLHSCRSSDPRTLPMLSFTRLPPNGRDGRERKCQQKFPDRQIFTSEHCLFSPSEPIHSIAC